MATVFFIRCLDHDVVSQKMRAATNLIQACLEDSQKIKNMERKKFMLEFIYNIRIILSKLVLFINMHLVLGHSFNKNGAQEFEIENFRMNFDDQKNSFNRKTISGSSDSSDFLIPSRRPQ